MSPIQVASLRSRGEPEERDVLVTRPGPWGNPYTVQRYGWRALDLYREWLRRSIERTGPWFTDHLFGLAGKRLLCACPPDAVACHAWILAEEVDRLTGCGVEPAPGRRATCR